MFPQQQPVPYPSAVTMIAGAPAAGPVAFHFFKGADWPMLIALFDPQTQQPLFIPPDTSFVADLYFANSPNVVLTLTEDNNGVLAIDPLASTVLLLAPKALTANAPPDGPAPSANVPLTALPGYGGGGRYVPPPRLDTRVVLWAMSGAGVKQPVAVFTIGVGDLRSVDQAYFQENQAALGYGTVSQLVNANVLRSAQFKRGMEQVDPGSAQAMFESGVFGNSESDPGLITWREDFAPAGGRFEQLYAQWLQLPAPAGRGMTPDQAAQRVAGVRLAAATL